MKQAYTGLSGLCLVLAAFQVPVEAQEAPQGILSPQFSFSNPGARSLGFGGAFVSLADDATAAWANPSGLVQLTKPEVSIEGRFWSYSTPSVAAGRVEGSPSGYGLDTVDGLRTEISSDDLSSLAFLSVVYPMDRWSIAAYRHVSANFESLGETQGLFADGTECCQFRFLDQRNVANLEIVSWGISAGYRILDELSLGAGLIYYDSSLRIQTDLYLWDDPQNVLASPTSFLPEQLVIEQTLMADDDDLGFAGGLLWEITREWRIGARYRQGPDIEVSGLARVGDVIDFGYPRGTVVNLGSVGDVSMPDTYGLGVTYRTQEGRLTTSFEWDRVTYSDVVESLELDDQDADDADELHLGGEWAFLGSKPMIALRLGAWFDPEHELRANVNADALTRALLQPGEDQIHFAIGLGIALAHLQIDMAADFSDSVDIVSVSAIYGF